MQISSIITKTGDNGTTSLWNGTRVLKSDPRIMFGSQLDNLNASFGIIKASLLSLEESDLQKFDSTNWIDIFNSIGRQNQIIMGEILSGISYSEYIQRNIERFDESMVNLFESYSKIYSDELEKCGFTQNSWFSYGDNGTVVASLDCLSRQIRSFELYCWQLKQNNIIDIRDCILIYFNRMSDFIYILARYIGVKTQKNNG